MVAPKRVRTLARSLRAWDVLVLTLSALSPAASVYITGSAVLHMAGTGAAMALLLGGGVAVLASMLYAELGAAFPQAGGVYPGVTAVLGPGPGRVVITLGLITAPATLAFAALGLADYLRVLAPSLPRLPLACATLGSAALLCILNIRASALVTAVLLAAEMGVLLVLAVAAGLHPTRGLSEVLAHPMMLEAQDRLAPTPHWTLMLATLSGAYACAGSGLAIYFSEDIRGMPGRIGRLIAWIGAIGSVIVIVPVVLLTTSIVDLKPVLAAEAPISAYLTVTLGYPIAYATSLVVALAILNNIIASMLAFSRFLYATGRDEVWPRPISAWLSKLHKRFGSPWFSALTLALAAGLLCLLGERSLLVLLSGE